MTTTAAATVQPAASASRRGAPPPWVIVTVLTTAVVVFSTIRGLVRGFQPIGDNALIELRAWDVFTSDRPLLGTWSSASVATGLDVNHPGPLLFDYFALPVRLLGGRFGLAFGAAVLNLGALWASVLVARRVGGAATALATAVAAAVLTWAMGSELLFDTWQPNILVLPFFCFLVLMWAVWCGHAGALPWAVLVGSLCVQAHLSYLFLVPALLIGAVVVLIVRDGRQTWSQHHRSFVLAIVVGVVAWAQPLWEQFTSSGEGNLSRLLDSSGTEGARNGVGASVRMLSAVLALPPWFGRPGYDSAIPASPWTDVDGTRRIDLDALPALPLAVLGLVVLVAVLIAAFVLTRRSGDEITPPGVVLIGVALLVALFTAVITPVDPVFGVVAHKVRWLWALGAFIAAVLVGALLQAAARRSTVTATRASWVAVAVGVVVSLLTIPTYRVVAGPVDQPEAWAGAEALREQLGPLEGTGTVFVDLEGIVFAEPYSWALMAELARRDIPFLVAGDGDVRQVGDNRRFDGGADVRLFYRTGPEAEVVPPGATRVAYVSASEDADAIAVFVEPFADG